MEPTALHSPPGWEKHGLELDPRDPSSSSIPASLDLVYPWMRHTPSLDFHLFFDENKRRALGLPQVHSTASVHESGGFRAQQTPVRVSIVMASAIRTASHETQGISSLGGRERAVVNEDLIS